MGAIVKVRNVKLGDGMPKICIPVTDTNLDDLKKSVNLIRNTPFDLIEWRADFYDRRGRSGSPDQGNDLIPQYSREISRSSSRSAPAWKAECWRSIPKPTQRRSSP